RGIPSCAGPAAKERQAVNAAVKSVEASKAATIRFSQRSFLRFAATSNASKNKLTVRMRAQLSAGSSEKKQENAASRMYSSNGFEIANGRRRGRRGVSIRSNHSSSATRNSSTAALVEAGAAKATPTSKTEIAISSLRTSGLGCDAPAAAASCFPLTTVSIEVWLNYTNRRRRYLLIN